MVAQGCSCGMPWLAGAGSAWRKGHTDDCALARGPVVLVAAPGVVVVRDYECPDCGVVGDAIQRGKRLPGEPAPVLCLACMEVE